MTPKEHKPPKEQHLIEKSKTLQGKDLFSLSVIFVNWKSVEAGL